MGDISNKERGHLRGLIRQHYKLLRTEVSTEEAKALSEVESRIAQQRVDARHQADGFHQEVDKIMESAYVQVNSLITGKYADLFATGSKWAPPSTRHYSRVRAYLRADDESALRRAMIGKIRAASTEARLRIEREENEKLKGILLDALETETAHQIVASLPAVSELFKVDLSEIEA